jgi:DNA-binding transcriptional MerR regulator
VNVQQFATLAGVTVRAMHHYDRLGLLRARRSGTGYRVYDARDMERLEQIVALKFLGLPLKQIGIMLDRDGLDLSAALRMQRAVLEEKRRLLDRAIRAIGDAEKSIEPGRRADTALLTKIIEVIEMQNDNSWPEKYYSPEARAKIDVRAKEWTPELQAECSKQWTELFRDVEAALHEDPASGRAQALGVRWKKLVEGFTGGDREIGAGLNQLYADRPNWPDSAQQQMAPFSNPQVWEFMGRVLGTSG